jgi:hypothetical protein
MDILFGVCTDETNAFGLRAKTAGLACRHYETGVSGSQDPPVEDGARLLTPRRNMTDSYSLTLLLCCKVWE